MNIYRTADFHRAGDWFSLPALHNITQQVGADNDKVLTDLLINLCDSGWLLLQKWSGDAGQYVAFKYWKDADTFFYQGATVRIQVTIPGRRRKQALEAKEEQPTDETTP